jgi:hypothetical protein
MTENVDAKLVAILRFLKRNRKWNRNLQRAFYEHVLGLAEDPPGRLKSLLFSSVNAQSQPDLNLLCAFWRKVEAYKWRRKPLTVGFVTTALASFLDESDKATWQNSPADSWQRLFQVLRLQNGWGDKTAALFVKAAINVHRASDASLHFLTFDGPILKPGDRLYLPVDAVIARVFKELSDGKANFSSINKKLQDFSQRDMLVWDDLWFWGFITQRSDGDERKIEWNPGKFWGLQFSPKTHEKAIEGLAGEFIRLLRSKSA